MAHARRWLVGLLLVLCAPLARTHEYTLDAMLNAFVKIEDRQAHLVIRVPLYVVRAARFPIKGTEVDADQSAPALARALTLLQQSVLLLEDGRALKAGDAAARLALPSDRSFETYEQAAAHVAAPLERGTGIVVDQGYVDAHLVYPITSSKAVFAIDANVAPELGTRLTLRWLGPDGRSQAMVVRTGTGPTELNPTPLAAALTFVAMGITHIVTGIDHLLFLLCLVIPLRGWRQLALIVTGFTLAHSITLLGSAFGLAPRGAWFPPFVEMLIAVSIVYTALENIVSVNVPRRMLVAMLFGLVHGFAFSQGLAEDLQFAGGHLLVALFAFNVGIEMGQLAMLALLLPVLAWLTRHVLVGKVGSYILAGLIAHVGWHWMTDRWDTLAKVRWPSLDVSSLAVLALWAGALAIAATGVLAAVGKLRLEPAPRGQD